MKYKVLKEFVTKKGGIMKTGSEYIVDTPGTFSDALKANGFIEKIPEQPKTVWDLKDGDIYYQITKSGDTAAFEWDGNMYDIDSRKVGNVFLTKKEAEKEIARRKAKVILERDTKGFKPSRSNGYRHVEVYYTDEGGLDTAFDRGLDGCIYFESYEDAEASIKAHPNEWKTYLRVEE